MTTPVLVVLGAGPGVGRAVAERFHREGYRIALVARSRGRLTTMAEELRGAGSRVDPYPVDLTDDAAVRRAIDDIGQRCGRIDVLHFNPSAFRMRDPLHLTPAELFEDLSLGVAPLLPAVQAAHRYFRPGARVIATGSAAADEPWHEACSLGVQKAALRNLVTSLDATLEPDGVRAVAVQVNGLLAETGPFSPRPIASALYRAAQRSDAAWTAHVPYDG